MQCTEAEGLSSSRWSNKEHVAAMIVSYIFKKAMNLAFLTFSANVMWFSFLAVFKKQKKKQKNKRRKESFVGAKAKFFI